MMPTPNEIPNVTSIKNTDPGIINKITDWFAHPFTTNGSAVNWVLFVGLLIVAVWFWQVTLIHLNRDLA